MVVEKHSPPENEIINGIHTLAKENLEPINKDAHTGRPRQCQGDPSCKNHSLEGKAFCAQHMQSCPRKSPLNGWEPEYDPSLWNARKSIRHTHNCYSYAMNVHDPKQSEKCKKRMQLGKDCFSGFHQPGTPSNYSKFSNSSQKTCDNMYARLKGDNPDIEKQINTLQNDKEKIDGYNGLLLSPHVDHLFDRGFISFKDSGDMIISKSLNSTVLNRWSIDNTKNVGKFELGHHSYLEYHRDMVFL
jgi:hypothetical protein